MSWQKSLALRYWAPTSSSSNSNSKINPSMEPTHWWWWRLITVWLNRCWGWWILWRPGNAGEVKGAHNSCINKLMVGMETHSKKVQQQDSQRTGAAVPSDQRDQFTRTGHASDNDSRKKLWRELQWIKRNNRIVWEVNFRPRCEID